MKKLIVKLIGISLIAFYFLGCEDDTTLNGMGSPSFKQSVQFTKSDSIISENNVTSLISLAFDKPARSNGSLQLSIDTANTKYVKSVPALTNGQITVAFHKGDVIAAFAVTTTDNGEVDGNKDILFTLDHVSSGFFAGARKTFGLKILDDETPDDTTQSRVNFIPANLSIKEDRADWYDLQIHISKNLTANGSATIEAVSGGGAEYGKHFTTEPALVDNLVTLVASPGTAVLKLKIQPINNEIVHGNTAIKFKIKRTSGNLVKGALAEDSVIILDDELKDMPKGYDISAGSWVLRKLIKYNSAGKIGRIVWDSYTPFHRHYSDTYYYNDLGELTRIKTDSAQDLLYTYSNGRIVMEQKITNDIVNRYTEYDYDASGNISGYRTHYLKPDGQFSLGFITVLLYFNDGNLHKKLVYAPSSDSDDPNLISTETYENYFESHKNQFGIEFVPGLSAQLTLPGSYRVESNGKDITYTFSYEFAQDGKPLKRTVVGPDVFEVALYHYY